MFVPTTPNPTSGYLAIVPVQRLVPTSMTMDQAMTMIVSGGTVAPEEFSTIGAADLALQRDLLPKAPADAG